MKRFKEPHECAPCDFHRSESSCFFHFVKKEAKRRLFGPKNKKSAETKDIFSPEDDDEDVHYADTGSDMDMDEDLFAVEPDHFQNCSVFLFWTIMSYLNSKLDANPNSTLVELPR